MEIVHAIKCLTMGMPTLLTGGVPRCRAGDERLSSSKIQAPESLSISSPAFADGDPIPQKYTQDGQNISPPLALAGMPANARSLVLIVEDPDAPTPNPFVHWLAYNIPPSAQALPEAITIDDRIENPIPFLQGKNSSMKTGFIGCAPPKGDTAHRYIFQLYALDRMLDLKPAAGRSALLEAMEGHVIARGGMIGTYQRPK